MARSLFEWSPPPGTDIEQIFGASYLGQNGQPVYPVSFRARCAWCGATSTIRAARSDALEELDGHRCEVTR